MSPFIFYLFRFLFSWFTLDMSISTFFLFIKKGSHEKYEKLRLFYKNEPFFGRRIYEKIFMKCILNLSTFFRSLWAVNRNLSTFFWSMSTFSKNLSIFVAIKSGKIIFY